MTSIWQIQIQQPETCTSSEDLTPRITTENRSETPTPQTKETVPPPIIVSPNIPTKNRFLPLQNSANESDTLTNRVTTELHEKHAHANEVIAVLAFESVGTFLLAVTSKVETKEMLTDSVDAIALVEHAVSELSALRREQLKPSLRPEFHTKCANNATKTSNLLFEDDLAKQFSMRRRRTPWQNGGWPIQQTI